MSGRACGGCAHFEAYPEEWNGGGLGECYSAPPFGVPIRNQGSVEWDLSWERPLIAKDARACARYLGKDSLLARLFRAVTR